MLKEQVPLRRVGLLGLLVLDLVAELRMGEVGFDRILKY